MPVKPEWILSGSQPQQSYAYRFNILKKRLDIINVCSHFLLRFYTKEYSNITWLFLMYVDNIMLLVV